MANINATIKIEDTELFKKIVLVLKDILNDERIDESIRQEYGDMIRDIIQRGEEEC